MARYFAGGGIGSFSISADEVEGGSTSGVLFGGMALSRYVDLELEATLPASAFTKSYEGISVSFAPPGSSRAEIERLGVLTRYDKRRDVSSHLSGVVVFHPPVGTRVIPGFVVGVHNQHARGRTRYTPLSIPPGVDPNHPAVTPQEESRSRNLGGLTVGGQVAIALTPRLFVVPDLRYDYGSIGDEINNAWRAAVRVMVRM